MFASFLQTCNGSKTGKAEKLAFTKFGIILGDWMMEPAASATTGRVQKTNKKAGIACENNDLPSKKVGMAGKNKGLQ